MNSTVERITGDIQSKRLIVLKGVLFLILAVSSAALLVIDSPTLRTTALVLILIWSACRFYYFLFYVLEKYVDPSLKYAGIGAQLSALVRRRRADKSRLDA